MTTLLGAGDIIDRSAQFYRHHLPAILKIIVWNFLAGAVLVVTDTILLQQNASETWPGSLASLASGAPSLALSVFALILLSRLMAASVKGAASCPPATWPSAKRRFWPTAAAMLMLTALVFLGGAAFIIPGVIFWTWFAFAPTIMALGGEKIRQSFVTSRELVAGRFLGALWRLAAPLVFFFLLQMVLIFIVTVLLQGVSRGIWSIEIVVAGAPTALLFALGLIHELIRTALLPLFVFPVTLLYLALVDSKTEPAPKL